MAISQVCESLTAVHNPYHLVFRRLAEILRKKGEEADAGCEVFRRLVEIPRKPSIDDADVLPQSTKSVDGITVSDGINVARSQSP